MKSGNNPSGCDLADDGCCSGCAASARQLNEHVEVTVVHIPPKKGDRLIGPVAQSTQSHLVTHAIKGSMLVHRDHLVIPSAGPSCQCNQVTIWVETINALTDSEGMHQENPVG